MSFRKWLYYTSWKLQHSHLFNDTEALLAYTLEIIIKEK